MPEEKTLSDYINRSNEITKVFDRKIRISLLSSFTINGLSEFQDDIYGGEVGIMLDGRGRPFDFNTFNKDSIKDWSIQTNEYPIIDSATTLDS